MKSYKILLPQDIVPEGIKRLLDANCEIVKPKDLTQESLLDAIKDCDGVLIRTSNINRELIARANHLKVIARHGIGVDNIDVEAASEHGIAVCNVPNKTTNAVAEHVIGMMISLSHHIVKADKALRKGQFEVRNQFVGPELKGKTLGIIGFGNIGKEVARKAVLGFGMNVIAFDPYVKHSEIENVSLVDSIDTILKDADFVSLHAPYRPELHHFINKEALQKMKKEAFLINCGRGGLINEEHLYEAVKSGEIAGAGLDVFEQEPTPKDFPLWELDNIIVTPHMAAHTKEGLINMAVGAADEIIRVLNGEEPENCINKNKLNEVEA